MLVFGIDMEGRQDIIFMIIVENESVLVWSVIFDDFRGWGVKDIFMLCFDNLMGLDKVV